MKKLKNIKGDNVATYKLSSTVIMAIVLMLIVVVNVGLYAVVELFGWYVSKPDKLDTTISGATDTLFASAIEEKRKVKISFCIPEKEISQHETGYLVYETAKHLQKRYPSLIELDYINIVTRRNDKGELIDLSKYQKDMRGYDTYVGRSSIIFESGNSWRVLTDRYTNAGYGDFYTFDSNNYATSYNGEEVLASLICWVLADEHKTAYFTQYHGEIVDIAFSNLLACAGYYIDVIDIRKNNIPDDADLLIISNPTSDFEQAREGTDIVTEMTRIRAYMENGGSLYVALDPYVKYLPALEGFLKEEGIEFSYSTASNGIKVRNMVKDNLNAITTDGFTLVADYSDNSIAESIEKTVSSYSDGKVIVRETANLSLSGSAKPLLISSPSSVLEADGKTVNSDGSYCLSAFSERERGGGKTSRLFVVPSIYLAVSDTLVTNGYSNKDFIFALFETCFGAENLPYGCNSVPFIQTRLENLTMGTANVYTAFIMLVPVSLAVVGVVINVRRKNR